MKRVAGLNARVTHLSRNTQWRNENILVIRLKRAYELPARSDGCRVLVDRLWPRGVSKAELSIQSWPKPLAPSTLLRKWFNHNPARWTEFKDRYFRELDGRGDVASLPLQESIHRYFEGAPGVRFQARLVLDGMTDFQKAIIRACRSIGYGKTLSYGELANRAGFPGAARAVGSVMSSNRHPLITPCHRVVAAGNRIGGFSSSSGTELKRALLELEGATVSA